MGARGSDLAVLAGVAVIGHHRRDASGAGALEGVEHQAQFHQIVIDGIRRGLDHENIRAAHVGADFDADLAVAKRADLGRQQGAAQVIADGLGQSGIGSAGQDFKIALRHANPRIW